MKAKIIDYLENELSPQEKTAFEQALTTDTDLQKAYRFQKEHWEKLAILRFNAKAATLLNSYAAVKEEDLVENADAPKDAVIIPMPYSFMTVKRARYAALAAATLLFLFNYNSLINWIIPNSPDAKMPDVATTKSAEPTPSVEQTAPVAPTPSVAPATPVAPSPTATVAVPKQPKPKQTPVATPERTPLHTTPEMSIEMAAVVKEEPVPVKVGSGKSDDSIFLASQPKKDTMAAKTLIEGPTIKLSNMYDFDKPYQPIYKHLSQIDCKNYTVSFVIKANGTVEQPKLEKGDKNCEEMLLKQIRTMPLLRQPRYDEKSVDYRYFFTKE